MKRGFKLKIKKTITRLDAKWFVAGGAGALLCLLFFGLIYAKTGSRPEKLRKQDTNHSEEKGEEVNSISSSDFTYPDNTSSRSEQNDSKTNSFGETEKNNDSSSSISSSNTSSSNNNPDNNQNNPETNSSSGIGGNDNSSSSPTPTPTVVSTPTPTPFPTTTQLPDAASTPTPLPTATPFPTSTPVPTYEPVSTPTPVPTATPTPTPEAAVSETKEVTLFPASSATPNANGSLTITAQKYDHGYWDFVILGSFRFLQPQRLYQVWLCNTGCSSHTDAKFQTDESGNASLSEVVINHPQVNDPVSSIKVWELPPSGEIIEDPTTCYYISNDAKPCLEGSIRF